MYICTMYAWMHACIHLQYACTRDGYLHVDDVVVDAGLVLLQHLEERGYIFTGGEELQVGLGNSQG